jgi:twitching motility two-component system response regulator PilG
MMSAKQHKLDIALVGFNDRERLLMNSLFKVSGNYREWQEDSKGQPDYVLMDVDAETGRACADRELEHPSGSPIVAVGAEVSGKSIAAYIPRPFRWADVLNTLASVTKTMHPPTNREVNAKPAEPQPLVDVSAGKSFSDAPAAPTDDLSGDASSISISDVRGADDKPRIYKTIGAVLVVNPNPKGWRHVSAEVASLGYRVDHVSTGAAAALLLANFRYNCVIVETQLPDQDGFDLCKLLKKTEGRRRTATIVLTTSRNPIDRIKSKYVGCDAFISKPIDREELARTLKRFLPEYTLEVPK